jgi:hypothetical protein
MSDSIKSRVTAWLWKRLGARRPHSRTMVTVSARLLVSRSAIRITLGVFGEIDDHLRTPLQRPVGGENKRILACSDRSSSANSVPIRVTTMPGGSDALARQDGVPGQESGRPYPSPHDSFGADEDLDKSLESCFETCRRGLSKAGAVVILRSLDGKRMSRPAWNLGDGPEHLSYAATSFSGV